MNRHERRRQQKNNKINNKVNENLLEGIKLHTNKEYKKAEVFYNQVLAEEPSNYDAIRHLGILFQDLKDYERAYQYFIQAVKINPRGFEALNNLGTIHLRNKSYDLAFKCFQRSIGINNKYLPSINNLAAYYYKITNPSKALEFAELALKLQPSNQMAKSQYAKALLINNKADQAIMIFEKLNADFPDVDDHKYNLTSAYKEMGEFEKANKIATAEFKIDYKKLPFLLTYTNVKNNKLEDKHIQYYEGLLNKTETDPADKVLICHSFFNYFKHQRDYNKAGEYLVKGNNLQYKMRSFDLENDINFFKKIESLFSVNINFQNKDKLKKNIPIFICGMPRSGTTLCEQILSSHSKIEGAGELAYLAAASGLTKVILPSSDQIKSLEQILNNQELLLNARQKYLRDLADHGNEESIYICDKMPHNFILIGLIKILLPEAKIIYCKRDPIDNCFSLYSHKFVDLSHQYSYDQKVLVKYYRLHEKLMDFWFKKYAEDIFILDNEELVNNQEKVSKELISFCELSWEKQCLEFFNNKRQVRTASIEQVRKPMTNKSIGAWKKYEKNLENMIQELKK